MPSSQTCQGWRNAFIACGRTAQRATPAMPPMPKEMAMSWNGGMVPLAAVKKARKDQSKMATKPMRVAVGRDNALMMAPVADFESGGNAAPVDARQPGH